jgi:tetratricopeptide (TPR) repeat protein
VFCALTGCSFFSEENSDAAKAGPAALTPASAAAPATDFAALSADLWIDLSSKYHQEGRYLESIGAAQSALYLRPDYPEAYNNIGAAYASLQMWDPAIQAAQQALRLRPDFPLARNNLAWALEQKRLTSK